MDKVVFPVLKAWNRVFELLEAINNNPYNRSGFQEDVLRLYPGKSPKSVFRGMAIPTLRNLGFIIGYGDVIRISANGALVFKANDKSSDQGLRGLRAVLFEIDDEIGILSYLQVRKIVSLNILIDDWNQRIEITNSRIAKKPEARIRAARERIRDWVKFLEFSEILCVENKQVRLNEKNYSKTESDIDINKDGKHSIFASTFFSTYRKLVSEQQGIRTIEIELLRREVAIRSYSLHQVLITATQFDLLLSGLQMATDDYTITFGRSMGAEEKLFFYQGKFFQTVSIRSEGPPV